MPRVTCPASYRPSQSQTARLYQVLGPAKFAALQEAFGGRRIWVPKRGVRLSCHTCALRDDCIMSWRRRRVPVQKMAKFLGISSKRIYSVLRGTR